MQQNEIPMWIQHPVTRLEKDFVQFNRENPEVYQELESRARSLVAARTERFGISLLIESMRYSWALGGRPFAINNSYRSLYARLLLFNCPWLDGVLALRQAPALHGPLACGDVS